MHWLVAVAIAVCFVLGSWLWLRPSPEQRRLAALRNAALLEGVQVRLVGAIKLPLAGLEPFWAVYMLPSARGSLQSWAIKVIRGAELPPALNALPGSLLAQIHAVGVHAGSPFVVWNERGGQGELVAIKQLLSDLKSQPSAQ